MLPILGGEGRRILIFHELPDNHLADASTATDSIRQNPKSQHHETQIYTSRSANVFVEV